MQNTSTHQGNGHVCSVIPPFLLTDILTHDGFSPATKFAVTKTLNHLGRLQERRQLRRAQNFLTLTEGSSTEGGKVTDEEISYIAADDEAGSDPPVAPVENGKSISHHLLSSANNHNSSKGTSRRARPIPKEDCKQTDL